MLEEKNCSTAESLFDVKFSPTRFNRLLSSSKTSHFQSEAKCQTFVVKMRFARMRIKNHVHVNGSALNLALIQGLEVTRKWRV